jgi:hypothetical protein
MRVPGVAGFGLDVRESRSRRRARDADEMLAGRALDLPPGIARIALQRLITVGTIEFKISIHKLHFNHAPATAKKYMQNLLILFARRMRL